MSENEGVTTLPEPTVRTRTKSKENVKKLPPYHVVLLNDDDHSFEYVIKMLQQLFGHPPERGYQMAYEVHTRGRVIVDTTSKERAELKRDQIHAFGPDPDIARCQGSMSATIEPAE
ncbi:MAG: ATP-dependent Clp protease adaptor ClpS [Gemmataceae bacterium]|nr:ATP-dependent Clp protease adaptor ClpS [Gemmataceae bacterium]